MIYVILVLAVAAGFTILLMKNGKIKDDNNNNIPDVIENKAEEVKKVVNKVKKTVKKSAKPAAKTTKAPKKTK